MKKKMENSIENYPIPLVFKRIYLENLSGELYIKGSALKKTLVFRQGTLIQAQSNIFDERIGVVLHLIGRISDTQYDYISGLVHSIDEKVGKILVQNHFVSKVDLVKAQQYQCKKIAITSFSLESGQWEFIDPTGAKPKKPVCSIPVANLIYEGGKRAETVAYINKKYHFFIPWIITLPPQIESMLQEDEVDLLEKIIYLKNKPNEEIISKLNIAPDYYWERISIFFLLGVIDFSEQQPRYNIEEDIQLLVNLREKIENQNPDHFEILGIDKSSTHSRIQASFISLSQRFNPDRFGSAYAPEIKRTAQLVHDRIKAAYEALSPPGTEEDSGIIVIPAEMEILDLPPEEEIPEIDMTTNINSMPEPEFIVSFESAPETSEKNDVLSGSKEEYILIDHKSDNADRIPEKITKKDEIIEPIPIKPEMKTEVKDQTPSQEARQLFLRAKNLFYKNRFDEAIPLLKQVIRLQPANSEYILLLGICQSQLMFFHSEAEQNLKKTIELDPANPDPVFALGELFKTIGKAKLAEKCYRRTLEMDPGHIKAERALKTLFQPQKKKPGSFKKKDKI